MGRFLFFVIIFCSIWLASCKMNRRPAILILHEECDIETKQFATKSDVGYFVQVWTDTNGHIFAKSLSSSSQRIWKLDCIEGKVLDSVDLCYKPIMELRDMTPIGKDSFLIAVNSTYDNDLNDGAMLVLDRNQHIIDTVSVEALPVRTRTHLMIDDENMHFISYLPSFPLVYKHSKIFVPLLKWSDRCKTTKNAVGYITYPCEKGVINYTALPITYPEPRANCFWPLWYRRPIAAFSDDVMFTMFGNYPMIYKYDIVEDKLTKHKLFLSTVGDISPYKIQEEPKPYDAYRSKYEQIVYDSNHKVLYVLAKVGCNKEDGPLAINRDNAIYSFTVLDENLHQIGEGILPQNYFPSIIPYKDGFLLSKLGCGRLIYTYFTYTVVDKDSRYLQNQIKQRRDSLNSLSPKLSKDEAYLSYFKRVIGKDYDKYSSFLLFSESACPFCSPLYHTVLLNNKQAIIDGKVAIIMANRDESEIKDFCDALNTRLLNCNELANPHDIPVYGDTLQYYTYFIDYWINAMYLSFNQRHKICQEQSIHPGNIEDLPIMLREKMNQNIKE